MASSEVASTGSGYDGGLWLFIAKKLVSAVATLVLVLVAVFFVFQVIGDPARRTLPLNSSEAQIERYRQAMGFADPIATQFWRFFSGAIHLDFGTSTTAGQPALGVVLDALPRSLILATASFIITVAVGMGLGVLAGLHVGSGLDRLLQAVGAVASSIPEFWSGLVLIILLAVKVQLFPTGGYGGLQYLALPAIAMSIPPMGRLMYVVRESVRSATLEPYTLVARSKGLRRTTLVRAHIVRAALIPIVSVGGLELTRMSIGGVVVIEAVFAWPGLGGLYVEAMERYDLALVSATLFITTAVVLLLNTCLDVLYTRLDPRLKLVQQ